MMTNINRTDFDDLYIEPEISEYWDFINDSSLTGSMILTPQKIDKNFEKVGRALNLLLVYPDILSDIMTPLESSFSLYFYQRLILRSNARHREVYTVGTRALSKSFLAFFSRYTTAMELPHHQTFVCADVQKQAVNIAQQKVQNDLWVKYPLLANEMIKIPVPGKAPLSPFLASADTAEYRFSNGSKFNVVGIDSARGLRANSGIIEEVIEQDPIKLNEKIIPLMNVSRRTALGVVNPKEHHAAKLYVTTAGYKSTFAYEKFIETLCKVVLDPDNYMVLSFTYKVPLMHGLLDAEQLRGILMSPTFDKDSFDREYNSIWSGAMKGAAFTFNAMKRVRRIKRAELSPQKNLPSDEFYVVTADMAKDGQANTSVGILHVIPQETSFLYKWVNGFKIDSTDYLVVGNTLKRAALHYNARLLVYDANGIGAAIRDWLNKPTIDEQTGDQLPGLGIINPPSEAAADVIKYNSDMTICYEIKATGQKNSDINRLFFGRFNSGSIKMLIPFREALERFKNVKGFALATRAKQMKNLQPYQIADILQEELLNLDVVEVKDGSASTTLKVTRRNSKIQKDFFSAFEYGVYAVHTEIELSYYKKRRKKRSKAAFITLHNVT